MLVVVGFVMFMGVSLVVVMVVFGKLVGVFGWFELVGYMVDGVFVYVDYVYKLDVFENVLIFVCFFIMGCVIVVFGCGGDCDKGKWLLMGEIVVWFVDVVIVMDDNLCLEVFVVICLEIFVVVLNVIEILDCVDVICMVCGMLIFGDMLIVVGKGYEEG